MTHRPKKALGQNFLVDPNLQRKTVAELGATPDDVVLEVGPGHGELSAHLVGEVHRLVLVEKDRELAGELEARWGDRADAEVIQADALETDLSSFAIPGRDFRVLSNVPYNVTSPLIFAFLDIRPLPRRIVLTVQLEVAERVVADPGSKTYGALSVGVQAIADARLVFRVGRHVFRPVPRVDSAVLVIDPIFERAATVDIGALRTVTRAMFGQRRKQIQKILRSAPALSHGPDPTVLMAALGLDPAARPETLSPADFVSLSEAIGQPPES
ncbi:MAG: 16S rRNA (adenine(1518)-N(6)/adenine(1519)-N(6))-dimethyltransferase RsmA [Gemmatimonadota bacterium]|nr:16S rRNA (adenine(1518)-N(6)/adenine(1519)-N(6))-dimethyltransferase RsmA [Gemmatimonadota bacterium]